MPKYLVHASYSVDGTKGLIQEGGTSRRATVDQLISGMGGKIESFYFTFGDSDVVVIADMPDEEAMTALALAINASGAVTIKTTVLITPEQVDEAAKRTVAYRHPGA